VKSTFPFALLVTALSMSACSVLEGSKVDYKSAAKPTQLAVPPDLTQLAKDTRYTVVNGAVSAAGSKNAEPSNSGNTIAPLELADIRAERMGNQRWLVVKRTPEALWAPLKDFWQENGFPLETELSDVGIMESEWVENKSRIPQDMIRSALSRVFENLYSSPERRKFRTRLERNVNGDTEIFISYRSMVEVYINERGNSTTWQVGPTDPETEAEYLGLLMRKLAPSKNTQALTAEAGIAKPVATLVESGGQAAYVQLSETFDRAWRRVGLTLDRSGFSVEDRDRAKGLYFVRYVPSAKDDADASFLDKIKNFKLGGAKDVVASKFQIELKTQGDTTTIKVLNSTGANDTSVSARTILKVLANDLK
jgi:outer membrane protein assembly factor BamC